MSGGSTGARPGKVSEVLTTNIRLESLETAVFSPRKNFSMRYIDELAEDIEREGQLKPIIVRPHPVHACMSKRSDINCGTFTPRLSTFASIIQTLRKKSAQKIVVDVAWLLTNKTDDPGFLLTLHHRSLTICQEAVF